MTSFTPHSSKYFANNNTLKTWKTWHNGVMYTLQLSFRFRLVPRSEFYSETLQILIVQGLIATDQVDPPEMKKYVTKS